MTSDSSRPGETGSSSSGATVRPVGARVVGQYEITGEIGRGGAAIVYLARQSELDRLVALKELRVSSSRPEDFARRFLRESRVAGSLSHPNIVTVYDYFEHDGSPYIVMEYLKRGSLRPYVGTLDPPALAGVLEGVLGALTCAESAGIVHRDLKPENIMVTTDGRVKLTDFGIAKATQKVGPDQFETTVGMTVGTPSYMAPEQALGEQVGPWTDLYAVGIMTWEHLVGHVPFSDSTSTPTRVLLRHVNEQIPPPITERPDMDPALSEWVAGLLANQPGDRPQTAAEAWDALEQIVVAQLGPLWRREARLTEEDSRGASAVATPEPADRFGAYPVIPKPDPQTADPSPPPVPTPQGQTAREDESAYHTYLGEDAATAARAEPAPAPVVPPPPPIARTLVLRPEAVRVRPGERAEIKATLEGAPLPGARWELSGGAAGFATAIPIAGGAVIELRPGPGEPPWSSSLEVGCLERGEQVAAASAAVEILAEEVTPAPRPPPSAPPPTAKSSPPARTAAPRYLARLIAIAAALVYIGCLLVPAYVRDDNDNVVSFWTATHSDRANTPITRSQFWTLVGLACVVLLITLIGAFGARRFGGVLALIASLGLLGYSLTIPSKGTGYGFGHYGPSYFVSLAACVVMAAASAYLALAPGVKRAPLRQ